MRILHVSFCFPPDPAGGTEVYVESLCRHLQALGVEAAVAAPTEGAAAVYEHAGLSVHRYSVGPPPADVRELYAVHSDAAAEGFEQVLRRVRPDVVHFHAFTRGVNAQMALAARRLGAATVFTYHTPTVSCQRGTLMEGGTRVCDGVLDVRRCAACAIQAGGLGMGPSRALALLPTAVGAAAGRARLRGGAWTAIRMSELTRLRQGATRTLFDSVDAVVAVAAWVRDLLVANGVPPEKVTLSRQGLADPVERLPARAERAEPSEELRTVLLARLDPIKGVEVVLRALREVPRLSLMLDVYAIPQGAQNPYAARVLAEARLDPRVRILPPVGAERVVETIGRYDLALVPSQGLETGPLVVYEAFAAGVPVVGSRLGGIAELVRDGVDGLLVEPAGSAHAWAEALVRLQGDAALRSRLRDGILPPRTMREVATEMLTLYHRIVPEREGAASGRRLVSERG